MKISAESYAAIDYALRQVSQRKSYAVRHREIVAEGRAKDPDKRTRWDMLWAAKASGLLPKAPNHAGCWICSLYDAEGLNDEHIDTALRNIIANA